ncbi:MAG TPA: FlgD immunoglobulin-like domain containing protein [Bacteroidota bacterium]|nr:FlgD immunoglobulin-like domain containing protein [Bacteroidota bacterium]
MRFFSLFLSVLILSVVVSAQKRYLVSPNDEVIPIDPGKSASASIKEWKQRMVSSRNGVCSDKFYFGYPPYLYTLNTNFGAYHKDVMGQWFTSPATGTIDTVFWEQWNAVNTYDSTLFLRIHESYIGPEYGPGVRPGPFNPPCQNWGYWVNTNDLDQGVAAFIEEATDTSWVSTIQGSPVPSGPPFGIELWGFGGVAAQVHAGELNWYNLGVLGVVPVTVGDKFFISQRVNHDPSLPAGGHEEQAAEGRTEWGASGFDVSTSDEDYPARDWKFYEHDKGPSNCAGAPLDSIRRGWVNRGGFTPDTLNVAVWNWWYSMTVSSNVPPIIVSQNDIPSSFDVGDKVVSAIIEDCNPETPGDAGVDVAIIRYSVNNVQQPDIAMIDLGSDAWEGNVPGQPAGSTVTWKILATDINGATGIGPPDSYSIIRYGSEWFSIDTGYACVTHDISSSGAERDTSTFFSMPYATSGTTPMDDGTSGPVDMGANFSVFGDVYRYAWIGVNGAIALTKSATDTADVNANGFYNNWNIPSSQHHGRGDSVNVNGMPPMFVAPFWADHIIGDTAGQYGRILSGNDGDTCLFIVQWDSIGAFALTGPVPDIATFRVVLNRCTGVVEYQYESVGTFGLDTVNLVGLQQDSTAFSGPEPGWLFYNRLGYPIETRPYDGHCVRFYPNVSMVALDGWNMLAVSLTPNNANYDKSVLFPTAVSSAYEYTTLYTVANPLVKSKGYWLKFDGAGPVGQSPSTFDHDVTATVQDKWNMIGGPSGVVDIITIVPGGGTVVSSSYFGYGASGYYAAPYLYPGKAYWVKVAGAGTLGMNSGSAAPKAAPMAVGETDLAGLNKVTIQDAAGRSQTLYLGGDGQMRNELSFYELPPVPPAGSYDVRFASQRMVESYPDMPVDGRSYDYPVAIQGAVYPVVVRWEMNSPVKGARKLVLSDITDGKSIQQVMDGAGSFMIKSENVKNVVIRLSEGVNIPATFALSQNYPNPFNPVTHFTVALPKATEVEVAVYDILGRKIASLLNGNQPAGQYTLEWNGRDDNGMAVTTGMYFLRVSSDEFNAARKVMLMK